MGQLIAVSGADLVAVLHEAGFTREHAPQDEPAARMTRAGITVSFDTRGIVPPETLMEVLTAARISIGSLLDGIDSVGRRAPRKRRTDET